MACGQNIGPYDAAQLYFTCFFFLLQLEKQLLVIKAFYQIVFYIFGFLTKKEVLIKKARANKTKTIFEKTKPYRRRPKKTVLINYSLKQPLFIDEDNEITIISFSVVSFFSFSFFVSFSPLPSHAGISSPNSRHLSLSQGVDACLRTHVVPSSPR